MSTEARGRIFILGNTGTGKTSLARTLKNQDMQSFLTGDPPNKLLEKTKILEIHRDLKFKTIVKEMVQEPSCEGNSARTFVKICLKRDSETILEQDLKISVYDFGGDHEYFLGSRIFFCDNRIYLILVNSHTISPKNLTSSIGNYLDLVLQNSVKPVICLVTAKNDLGGKSADELSFVVDWAEKDVKFFTQDQEEGKRAVYLYGEVLMTSSKDPEKW